MNWTELLKCTVEDTYKATDGLMALVQDKDLAWKPDTGSNWMTTGQLLMHLTSACGFCCRGFATGDWGAPPCDENAKDGPPPDAMLPPAEALPSVGSVKEARALLAADKKVALDMIAQAGEQKLANQMVAAPWDPTERSLGHQFLCMTEHLAVHKSQLFYYLKLMGRDVNTMHLWGM
ncbi:MAG: DinB family protein [Candidatus Latescibacteria bacterium]|nr:DinB family protein [Candidatus Latescibacterota bacterium]